MNSILSLVRNDLTPIFDTMAEAKVLIEMWMAYYNTIRHHSSLSYMPPAPEARVVDISLQMA